MMKKYLLAWFAATLFLLSCPNPYEEYKGTAPVAPPADAWYYEITNGVFLGGSLLYNATNDNLNHFKSVKTVPIRLAQLNATSKNELFDKDVIDTDTGDVTTTQETRTEIIYEEIETSVLTGSMTISAISATGITFNYVLYDKDMNKDFEVTGANIALGATYDFNSDGLADLTFRGFEPGSRTGYDGTYEVAFLSDKTTTPPHTTMHKAPDDPSFPFPSGIVTVTPSGKLVVQSENFSISNQDKDTIALTGTVIPSLSRQDYIVDLSRSNGVDGQGNELEKGAIRAIDTLSAAGSTVTYETVDIPAQSAYEVMNLTLVGNVDHLAARYLSSDSRSIAGGSNQRSIYVSLLNLQGTHSFPLPPGITGSAQLEYLMKLGI